MVPMKLLTPPAAEPITVAEAKAAARISDLSTFDSQLPGLIAAARQLAEQIIGAPILSQVWQVELPDWPSLADVLPVAGATAVAATYWAADRTWQPLPADPEFAPAGPGTQVAPAYGTAWPQLGALALGPRVRLNITAGAASPADVGEDVRLYIKAMVAHWIDHPGAVAESGLEPHPIYARLLDRAKVY
jgi:uncharacterized phiE125 gp8 family phage protein